jgi:phage-related protein
VDQGQPKKLNWIASSRRDMRALPKEVRRSFGVALYAVQIGETPPIGKPLRVFQKKSKRGRETPQHDIELIKERLNRAQALHALKMKEGQL